MSDPASAVQSESNGDGSVNLDWMGVTVAVPAANALDIDTLAAFEQGQIATAARGLFGDNWPAVVSAFRRAHGRKPAVPDLEPLMERVAKVYGFDSVGE